MPRSSRAKARKAKKNPGASRMATGPHESQTSHYSMQQEARNTEARSLYRAEIRLRHKGLQFVRAVDSEPDQRTCPNINNETVHPAQQNITTEAPTIIPLSETNPTSTELVHCITELRTPSPEIPSDDEVVFNGRRNRPGLGCDLNGQSTHSSQRDLKLDENAPVGFQKHTPNTGLLDATPTDDSDSFDGLPAYLDLRSPNPRHSEQSDNDDDDLLADYIANIDEDYACLISDSLNQPRDSDHTTDLFHEETLNRREALSDTSSDSPDDLDTDNSDGEDSPCNDSAVLDDTRISPTVGSAQQETSPAYLAHSRRQNLSRKNLFASATAFADALETDPYYGFDIMDFTRSSLRKQKKGKSRSLGLELFDTELEAELENAWKSDRLKKKIKKQEREKLRMQGLLGRRKDDPDLKVKYAHSIGIEDLQSEIRVFLLSSKNSLSLPPMPKQRRVLVHQIANAFRLNSQSRGKGSARFPVLSKTSRTPQYTSRTISQTEHIFSKDRFGHRVIRPWDKKSGRSGKSNRGHSAATYVDGDVVGGSAPEIGAENKGRAMLEKMGWSTGTALGASHNKGILLPVAHVVKNSKAGLG